MKVRIVIASVFCSLLLNINLCAQTARNPITNNTTHVNQHISSLYGPRLVTGGSRFHPAIDFSLAYKGVAYAVEGGTLTQVRNVDNLNNNSYAYITIGNWTYMHMLKSDFDDLWEVIPCPRKIVDNDLIVIRHITNGVLTTRSVYSPNPTGIFPSGQFDDPLTTNTVNITNVIPVGTDIFRAGTWSGGAHLDLKYGDGWTNPLSLLPKGNFTTASLTPSIKQLRSNSLNDFPAENIVYGNILLQGEFNYGNRQNFFNELQISIKPKGQLNYSPFFNWRYSGGAHVQITNRSTGFSNINAHNVRSDYTTTQQARDDAREGIFPFPGSQTSHGMLKKKWETQDLVSSNPYDARFPDSEYTMRFESKDLSNRTTTSDKTVILDNYLPFIQNVEIYLKGTEFLVYRKAWSWTNNSYSLGSVTSQVSASNSQDLRIRFIASESLSEIEAWINSNYAGKKVSTQSVDLSQKEWVFDISSSFTKAGSNTIRIRGKDLAGNLLQINPGVIALRDEFGNRSNGYIQGDDNNHTFSTFSNSTITPDFAIIRNPMNRRDISFQDLSLPPTKINIRQWNFNNESSSSVKNPSFIFNNDGLKNITLTVKEGASTASFTKTKTLLIEPIKAPIPDFNVQIKPEETNLDVTLSDATEGIVGNWEWTIEENTGSQQNSKLKSTQKYYGQNITEIKLNKETYYNVTLKVENETGIHSITKPNSIFFEEGETPYIDIYATKTQGLAYEIELSAYNFINEINYTIDYGDGVIEYHSTTSLHLVLKHQYSKHGEFDIKVTANGRNVYTGEAISVFASKRIRASYDHLDVTMTSVPASNFAAWEQINFKGVNTNRNEERRIHWSWNIFEGSEYDPNIRPIHSVYGSASTGEPIKNFDYIFKEWGSYVVNLKVWNDNGLVGEDKQAIFVSHKLKPVMLEFLTKYPDGVCINTPTSFEGQIMVNEERLDLFPSRVRWTVIRNGKVISGYPKLRNIDFRGNPRLPFMDITFQESGRYTIRLETWCTNKVKDSDAKPSNVALPYYDIKEIEVIVSSELSALLLSKDQTISPDGSVFNITVTNPGNKQMNWNASLPDHVKSWLTIIGGSSGSNNGVITVRCNANNSSKDRIGYITVTAAGAQESPSGVLIKQHSIHGAVEQIVGDNTGGNGGQFGFATAICGEYAVVGSPTSSYEGKSSCGSFSLLRKISGEWKVIDKFFGNKPNGKLGYAVALTGETLLIGEPGANSVRFFFYDSSRIKGDVPLPNGQILRNSMTAIRPNIPGYGSVVAISGDHCLIGSQANTNGTNSGSVEFGTRSHYVIQGGSIHANVWNITKTILGEKSNDHFGCSVDIDGDLAVVGAKGARYAKVYNRNLGGSNNWGEEFKIVEASEFFGKSVSISGSNIVVTDYPLSGGKRKGDVLHYYRIHNDQWMKGAWGWYNPNYKDFYDNCDMGFSISMHKDKWVVGAPTLKVENEGKSGRAFSKSEPNQSFFYEVVAGSYEDGKWGYIFPFSDGDRFGHSTDIDGQNIIVGAPGESGNKGLVFFKNYGRFINDTYCGTHLTLQNFSKYPYINYQDVVAQNIEIGGGELPSVYESGSKINYSGEKIILKPGVHVKSGANISFKTEQLCNSGLKSNSDDLLKSLALEDNYQNDSDNETPMQNGSFPLFLSRIDERIFEVRFTDQEDSSISLEVKNMNGEILIQYNNSADLKFELDFNAFQSGVYSIYAKRGMKVFESYIKIF